MKYKSAKVSANDPMLKVNTVQFTAELDPSISSEARVLKAVLTEIHYSVTQNGLEPAHIDSVSFVFFHSYTKPKGQLPDYTSPVVLKYGHSSVEDFCNKLHRSIIKEFK